MAIYNSLKILNQNEFEELFEIPKIDPKDRESLFEITSEDTEYLDNETETHNKINYVLQVGYFRATRNFYAFDFNQVKDDVNYIQNRYYPNSSKKIKAVNRNKHYATQRFIMQAYGYRRYDAKFELELTKQANRLSQRDLTPRFIFDELLHYCEQYQIVRPKYSTLQSIVSRAITREEKRLLTKLGNLLDKASRVTIDGLISNEKTISDLALLKKDPKGLTTSEMEKELAKQNNILMVFEKSKHMVSKLGISRQNLQYYSELCDYYDSYRVRAFSKQKARLLMLCLIWQRFTKINDHLIDYFIYKTNWYETEASTEARNCVYEAKVKASRDKIIASKMLKIVHDKEVAPEEIRPNCYEIVNEDKFTDFTDKLAKPDLDEEGYVWRYYARENAARKRNLRNIALSLCIDFNNETALKDGLEYAKAYWQSSDKTKDPVAKGVPIEFIPKSKRKYIFYKKAVKTSPKSKRTKNLSYIDIKRYEMALYQALSTAISAGNIFIPDSVGYRSLEAELIANHIWGKDKKTILTSLADCINTKPINEILIELKDTLNELYKGVNQRIKSGANKHIKINVDKDNIITWKLPYKKEADAADNPYYEKFKTIGIADVIDFTANKTNFYDSLSHLVSRGAKSKAKPEHIKAYLVSQGEAIGHKKTAESSDVSYQNLIDMEGKFIRVDSLVEAGDIIIDAISDLPIFKYYNLSDYGIHASLDGQKLETKYQTVLSRYSTKYFGYGKGVVSYSLIANHLPVSTKIIGANEHESHYVLDIIYNNNSDLKIKAVSGDMHSINRVNFALLYLFGYDFMPRITQMHLKAEQSLVAFKDMKGFKNDIIKPSSIIDEELITSEWDEIQRILASIARKDVSQSTIIKKLSSYSRKNRTLKALIEFDKIIMSIYMLRYIDDIQLRRNVHRALNRGEAFHQIRSALFQVNGKKILGKSENALEISNQCNRVLACCIIYYNASLLSELLTQAEARGDEKLCKQIKRLSPVAWQHISLLGNFVFCGNAQSLDIKGIVESVLAKFD
ncbi:Tn3 family transposase [Cysteiniphilum sp. 19S12-1]|uniref:Tn3 family transposase n=3 Tax=Cysteiniphilum TaxID=2056696 RepID=UPI003F876831